MTETPLTFLLRPDDNYGVFQVNKIIASLYYGGTTYRIVPERHWSDRHMAEIERAVALMNVKRRLLGAV